MILVFIRQSPRAHAAVLRYSSNNFGPHIFILQHRFEQSRYERMIADLYWIEGSPLTCNSLTTAPARRMLHRHKEARSPILQLSPLPPNRGINEICGLLNKGSMPIKDASCQCWKMDSWRRGSRCGNCPLAEHILGSIIGPIDR